MMRPPFLLLKYVGKAALNVLGVGIAGDFLFEALPDIAKEVWEAWSKDRNEQQRRVEVERIAQAAAEEIRQQVAEIRRELIADTPPEMDQMLESYLTQVPAMVRKSLRRPSDPTGTTVSLDLMPKKANELLAFLPPKLPRFKRVDHPLIGVDWELDELLGIGGFGEVWKAHNPNMTSAPPVALKFCLDAATAKVLRNEVDMLNRVMRQGKHPGIVHLQHTYLRSETPCLEYEYVEGGDLAGLLQDWHRSEKKPKPEQVAELILHLADIVGFAHRLTPPLVHRDLKPANILLQRQPSGKHHLKVADFGIGGVASQAVGPSRLGISRGEFLATAVRGSYTPLYASPQQMRGEPPDPRDDIFALGVIWYQLITGDLAIGRPGGTRWHKRLLEHGVSPEMVDLLAACFEDRVEDRPINAAALGDGLRQLLNARSVQQEAIAVPAEPTFPQPPTSSDTSEVKEAFPRKTSIKIPIKCRALLKELEGNESGVIGWSEKEIDHNWAAILFASPAFFRITFLSLFRNKLGDEGAAIIASSPHLANLETLYLQENDITDIGAMKLASSSYLKKITQLDLRRNKIGDAGMEALLDRFDKAVLVY